MGNSSWRNPCRTRRGQHFVERAPSIPLLGVFSNSHCCSKEGKRAPEAAVTEGRRLAKGRLGELRLLPTLAIDLEHEALGQGLSAWTQAFLGSKESPGQPLSCCPLKPSLLKRESKSPASPPFLNQRPPSLFTGDPSVCSGGGAVFSRVFIWPEAAKERLGHPSNSLL